MITIILCSVICGVLLTILVQVLWFYNRFSKLPKLDCPLIDQFPPVKLPKFLKEKLQDKDSLGKEQSCLWFNILSQYLFQELRDTQQVRRFLMKKMNKEFEELLQTTSGKFLDQIIVRDFNLGTTFPIVNSVRVTNVKHAEDRLDELDLNLDVDYNGGFQIALDVFLVLNKSAFLSVTMKRLKGQARLQLTKYPYTHWSFSFYEDPEVDFAVESHFEGRQLPQIANIIISQLRRSIRKKHTLPNYKMRFRPFFVQPEIEKPVRDLTVNGHNITTGKLDVRVVECSRLLKTPKDSFLYCSLSIDYLPYKELVNSRRKVWVSHDIEVYKNNAVSVGLSFKEEQLLDRYDIAVVVEVVMPDSPAALADIRKGDLLIAVGTTRITSTKQAAKLIKTAGERFTVRLERAQVKMNSDSKFEEPITFKDANEFEYCEESTAPEGGEEFIHISFKTDGGEDPRIKLSLQPADKQQKTGVNQTASANNTPKPRTKSSAPDLMLDQSSPVNALKKKLSVNESPSLGLKKDMSPLRSRTHSDPGLVHKMLSDDVDSIHSTETESGVVSDSDDEVSNVQKIKEVKASQNPKWGQTVSFDICDSHRYLNLCVWCKIPEKLDKSEKVIKPERHLLVGHVNIPLSDVCLECLITLRGLTKHKVSLSQGEMKATASRTKSENHPGFDAQLCYGDVTLLVKFSPTNLSETDRHAVTKEPLHPTVIQETASKEEKLKVEQLPVEGLHQFDGAQFPTATYCNFCGKKIWLKVAFQCQQCSMICHKKCVDKCQADTLCTSEGAKHRDQTDKPWSTPVVTSRLKKVQEYKEGVTRSKLLSKFRKDSQTEKKNVPTTLSLCPDPEPESKLSPVVSPSPRLSPRLLKKGPITKGVLESGDGAAKLLQEDQSSEDSDMEQNAALQEIHERRSKGQNLDELVVTAAKETGRELFTHLPTAERKVKLDEMVSKLQLEIDEEAENKSELLKSLEEASDQTQKQVLSQHLSKSDEKVDALMMLLLHYCAGLQHCLDQEQEERQRSSEQFQDSVEERQRDTAQFEDSVEERQRGTAQFEDCTAQFQDSVEERKRNTAQFQDSVEEGEIAKESTATSVNGQRDRVIQSPEIIVAEVRNENLEFDSSDDDNDNVSDSDDEEHFEKFRNLANQKLGSGIV